MPRLPEHCIKWASVVDKDPIQLEISKSLTHGRAPTYIQNPDQLQLLTGPNLEESWESYSDEDNHKGKLNESNLIAVTNATLPYEDEVDEFNDWRNNLSNLRGRHLDNHDEMIKEDIEQKDESQGGVDEDIGSLFWSNEIRWGTATDLTNFTSPIPVDQWTLRDYQRLREEDVQILEQIKTLVQGREFFDHQRSKTCNRVENRSGGDNRVTGGLEKLKARFLESKLERVWRRQSFRLPMRGMDMTQGGIEDKRTEEQRIEDREDRGLQEKEAEKIVDLKINNNNNNKKKDSKNNKKKKRNNKK
ncbi:hypothetical protein BY996DRAFT_6509050 [Phakopsora pachyrhizi]|nr:hypothetical protein BY996DRAFT_6509050 [Phakopsora pachyrhizi]